jgi:hypothetical protein
MLITFLELLSSAITDAEGARIRSLVDFQICLARLRLFQTAEKIGGAAD